MRMHTLTMALLLLSGCATEKSQPLSGEPPVCITLVDSDRREYPRPSLEGQSECVPLEQSAFPPCPSVGKTTGDYAAGHL